MDWEEQLHKILIREALEHFNAVEVPKSVFRNYIVTVVPVDDWEREFIDGLYEQYIIAINKTSNPSTQTE